VQRPDEHVIPEGVAFQNDPVPIVGRDRFPEHAERLPVDGQSTTSIREDLHLRAIPRAGVYSRRQDHDRIGDRDGRGIRNAVAGRVTEAALPGSQPRIGKILGAVIPMGERRRVEVRPEEQVHELLPRPDHRCRQPRLEPEPATGPESALRIDAAREPAVPMIPECALSFRTLGDLRPRIAERDPFGLERAGPILLHESV